MKKLILSIAVFAGVLSANAQTPVGTVVSNFNLTDINGNTQNLFAILDAGKMVVIDVSATWCGPCWNYHNTGALNTFYAAHGPAGANDAMVLFVEGDPSTNSADLNGTGTNTQTSATESETKLLNFIASKRQKGHKYIGYGTYDVTASDISKLKV